jgi:hypothetical protein
MNHDSTGSLPLLAEWLSSVPPAVHRNDLKVGLVVSIRQDTLGVAHGRMAASVRPGTTIAESAAVRTLGQSPVSSLSKRPWLLWDACSHRLGSRSPVRSDQNRAQATLLTPMDSDPADRFGFTNTAQAVGAGAALGVEKAERRRLTTSSGGGWQARVPDAPSFRYETRKMAQSI